MSEARKHPDLFTREEAAAYLHLSSVRSLETLRKPPEKGGFGLSGHRPTGRGYLYHREELDKVALRMIGKGASRKAARR